MVGRRAVADVALLDEVRGVAHRAGGVVEQRLLLRRGHQPEQVAGLLEVVVVVVAVVPPVRVSADLQRRLAVLRRSEEHTSELQSLMRISYAVFCLKKKKKYNKDKTTDT